MFDGQVLLFLFVYVCCLFLVFFFKQKTAYEMRISDWSSDVCSSDLLWLVQVPMKMQTGSITSRVQAVEKVDFSKLHQPTRRVVRNKNLDVIGVALSSSVR